MISFLKKPKKKIEILSNEEHIISLKDINIDDINKKYSLSSPSSSDSSILTINNYVNLTSPDSKKNIFTKKILHEREIDGSITSSIIDVKDIVEKETPTTIKSFSIVDESVIKKNINKSKINNDFINNKLKTSKKNSDINHLTSSLEKLGISNKEIIQTESYFKDDTGHEIKMLISGTNEYIKRDVEAKCWWCRHTIPKDWHPLGLPLKYIKATNEFHCEGIFCSFNCIMAHLQQCEMQSFKYRNCGTLVTLLYRDVFGKSCWTERLIAAPSWTHLREYGGKLTIEEFRNTFNKLRIVERISLPNPLQLYPIHTLNLVEKS